MFIAAILLLSSPNAYAEGLRVEKTAGIIAFLQITLKWPESCSANFMRMDALHQKQQFIFYKMREDGYGHDDGLFYYDVPYGY